jgi:hypothetical protein
VTGVFIRERFRHTAANAGNERISGAEIDTHRVTPFMRRRRLSRFADLKQCHGRYIKVANVYYNTALHGDIDDCTSARTNWRR